MPAQRGVVVPAGKPRVLPKRPRTSWLQKPVARDEVAAAPTKVHSAVKGVVRRRTTTTATTKPAARKKKEEPAVSAKPATEEKPAAEKKAVPKVRAPNGVIRQRRPPQKKPTAVAVAAPPPKEEEKDEEPTTPEAAEEEEGLELNFSSSSAVVAALPKVEEEEAPAKEIVLGEKSFDSFGLAPWLVATLSKRMGITRATRIQESAIPVLLSDRDALIKAETGSGKTLAYAIPLAHQLGAMQPPITRADGLRAVIVAPTRELCQQIFGIIKTLLTSFIAIVPGLIVGGQKKKSEKASLRKGVNVLVATPGRLTDHLRTTQTMHIARVAWLVLDEADRLLDLGFERDLSQLVASLDRASGDDSSKRRNVLVSATLNVRLRKLAYFALRNPVYTDTNGVGDATEALQRTDYALPPGLVQQYVQVETKERLPALAGFLRGKALEGARVLVFFSCIDAVEFHHALFSQARRQYLFTGKSRQDREESEPDEPMIPAPIFKLHGDLTQLERSSVYDKFKASPNGGIIFCTDVAARGIDLPNVQWIVQYDPPGEVADYVHRVGRTARIGHSGNALLFLLPTETEYLKLLAKRQVELKPARLEDFLHALGGKGTPRNKLEELAHFHQIHFEHIVLENAPVAELARKGFMSYTRAYSTHSRECQSIFRVDQLHTGHVAKSFALRENPSTLKRNMVAYRSAKEEKRRRIAAKTRRAPGKFGAAAPAADSLQAKSAEDTRRPQFKTKKAKKDAVRDPISVNQGKRRAMNMVLSEFATGLDAAPPKKRSRPVDN